MQRGCKCYAPGGFLRAATAAAVGLLYLGLSNGQTLAGGVTAEPADSLSVVGSTTGVLPQPAAVETQPVAAPSGPAESSWQSRFHVTGYLNQVFGMWF
jgi:hypothetical protein